jgi:hypothetical protein
MSNTLLKVEGVETYYGNIRALAGVDVEVPWRDRLSDRRQRRRQIHPDDDDLRQPAGAHRQGHL